MRILSIFAGHHDSAVTIFDGNKIKLHLPVERVTRVKHDDTLVEVLKYLHKNNHTNFDQVYINFLKSSEAKFEDPLRKLLVEEFNSKNISVHYDTHHLCHAYCGFYLSPFKKALCFVVDGHGASSVKGKETESIYLMNGNTHKELSKKYSNDYVSLAYRFETLSEEIGFGWSGAGKVMGLAQYEGYEDSLDEEWRQHLHKASSLQRETERELIDTVKKYVNETGVKNVVLTGGYALNCVANYKLKQELPDIKIFVDPICSDMGISIGQAFYHMKRRPRRIKNVYLGLEEQEYNLTSLKHKKTSYDEVSKMLADGKVIALFQGKAEAGYRALGNRSLLFDPRAPNGMKYLNKVKGRENFRPFAGSVLKEHVKDWFDTTDSPFMQYAVKVKRDEVPAITHVDGTCRVQTVGRFSNKHFYKIIKSFYKTTGVPILLNTSLNCAGEAIAETFSQAVDTCRKMKLDGIFIPELMIFVQLTPIQI